jgi:hypothetical protein
VEVFATATQIKAGDSIYFNGKILNNTNEKHDLHLEWKIPQDWKIIRSPETVSASAKSEKPFIAEIQSNRNALPCQQEINLHIKETGEVFIFQIGQQAPRKEYSAFPAEEDVIQEIRRLTFDIDTEQNKILLVHPGKRDYEKVKSIKASGICRYDNSGLHFLFRIEGAKHTKASNTADIWKGCCMQFAFNGKRLNQPYALSLALAQTCMNNTAVWDFLEGKFIDTVKGYWKNEGTHQIYYLFIPWQKLGFTAPPVGEKISFSATYNHNDNNGFAGYLEWTKGICNGILPNEYGNLLICEAKKKQ